MKQRGTSSKESEPGEESKEEEKSTTPLMKSKTSNSTADPSSSQAIAVFSFPDVVKSLCKEEGYHVLHPRGLSMLYRYILPNQTFNGVKGKDWFEGVDSFRQFLLRSGKIKACLIPDHYYYYKSPSVPR